jgi:hypothetical protein
MFIAGYRTKMCFHGNESDPDIWLTIENGRYVPARPVVYVPGLRQIQDRIHCREAHRTRPQFTSADDFVRLPKNPTIPTSFPRSSVPIPALPAMNPPATYSTQALPQNPNPESTPSTVTGESAAVSTPASNDKSAEGLHSAEASREKPSEEPPEALPKPQPEVQPENAVSATGDAPDLAEDTDSSMSNGTPPSPSDSSSSSLRSILKKTSVSNLQDKEPDVGTDAAGKAGQKNEMAQKGGERPKVKKSVSFAEDTVSSVPPANGEPVVPQATAAEEGAAIAKKLVQRENASQSIGQVPKRLGGANGSADVGSIARQSIPDDTAKQLGRKREKRGKQKRSLNETTKATGRAHVNNDEAGQELGDRARLAQHLLNHSEHGSYIDDEIPRKWP